MKNTERYKGLKCSWCGSEDIEYYRADSFDPIDDIDITTKVFANGWTDMKYDGSGKLVGNEAIDSPTPRISFCNRSRSKHNCYKELVQIVIAYNNGKYCKDLTLAETIDAIASGGRRGPK